MPVKNVSVVVPVYQNADTLVQLVNEISHEIAKLGASMEIVFVDDNSPDGARDVIKSIQRKTPNIKMLVNTENQGQQFSIQRGLGICNGDSIIVMDADLQDPPAAIPQLLNRLWTNDSHAVFASRFGIYQSRFRMICSVTYRSVICRLANLPKGAGGYVAMTRTLADDLVKSGNPRFYLAGLIGHYANAIDAIPVQRHFRGRGKSAYNSKMRLATGVSNILCVLTERYWYDAH